MTPSAMPVRSLTQSLLRWPEPELVLQQVAGWAERMAVQHPGLERVGVFGSYGRGDAGVGSDLDLLLIDAEACGPQHQRLLAWPLADLPLSCDALVLTPAEHGDLIASGTAMARALPASLQPHHAAAGAAVALVGVAHPLHPGHCGQPVAQTALELAGAPRPSCGEGATASAGVGQRLNPPNLKGWPAFLPPTGNGASSVRGWRQRRSPQHWRS